MKLTEDRRTELRYQARMWTLALLGGIVLLLALAGGTWLMLRLGIWQLQDR